MLALKSPLAAGAVGEYGAMAATASCSTSAPAPAAPASKARRVINAAGLYATQVARRLAGFPPAHCPTPHYAKGNYYRLAGRAPFSRLIYPLPEIGGTGVHITLDLGGQALARPPTWSPARQLDRPPDYRVDPRRSDGFYAEVRRYWPALPDGALAPAYCGVRPKVAPATPATRLPTSSFRGRRCHGVPGLVNLFGISRPASPPASPLPTPPARRWAL